jgi:hypothetical protein
MLKALQAGRHEVSLRLNGDCWTVEIISMETVEAGKCTPLKPKEGLNGPPLLLGT